MTKASMTGWHPEQELAALLDALTEEILTMPDRDIAVWPRYQAQEAKDAAQEMRRLVAAAESCPIAPPAVEFIERAYIARHQ